MPKNKIFKYGARFSFVVFLFCLTQPFTGFGKISNSTTALVISNDVVELRIPIASNPSFTTEAYLVRGKDNVFYATIPEYLNTNFITIEVVTRNNSTVKINGETVNQKTELKDSVEIYVSTASVNKNDAITFEVINSNGYKREYDVLLQMGNKSIDSLIYSFKEKYNIPGVSLAVVNLDSTKTIYQVGYGYAIKENKTRVLPSHLFRLASMSKQHTAIAIMKLVEEGRFGLDDYVFGEEGILKDHFSNVPARASRIKVRNLLEHTSGYRTHPDYMFNGAYAGWSMKQRIAAMLKSKQLNEPGSVFAYYNTGYGILGYIIEAVSGKTYEQYLTELYATVGINDIYVGGTQSERRANEVAYYGQNRANAEGLDMTVRAAAGGLIASTDELIKLLWALDGKPNKPDLLSPEYRQMMFTPSVTGSSRYALGWRTNHQYFPNSFYHGGTLAGVSTLWVYAEGYAVIILCNSRSSSGRFDDELYKAARDIILEYRYADMIKKEASL